MPHFIFPDAAFLLTSASSIGSGGFLNHPHQFMDKCRTLVQVLFVRNTNIFCLELGYLENGLSLKGGPGMVSCTYHFGECDGEGGW